MSTTGADSTILVSLTFIPRQCSCLENPRDGGAWWAAISGVARVGHDWSGLAAAVACSFSNSWVHSCQSAFSQGNAWKKSSLCHKYIKSQVLYPMSGKVRHEWSVSLGHEVCYTGYIQTFSLIFYKGLQGNYSYQWHLIDEETETLDVRAAQP